MKQEQAIQKMQKHLEKCEECQANGIENGCLRGIKYWERAQEPD